MEGIAVIHMHNYDEWLNKIRSIRGDVAMAIDNIDNIFYRVVSTNERFYLRTMTNVRNTNIAMPALSAIFDSY